MMLRCAVLAVLFSVSSVYAQDTMVRDTALLGAWKLISQSWVIGSTSGGLSVTGMVVNADGSVDNLTFEASTGTLVRSAQGKFKRSIVTAADGKLMLTDDEFHRSLVCDGSYSIDGDHLTITLSTASGPRGVEEFTRVTLGERIAEPVELRANMKRNGVPLRLRSSSWTYSAMVRHITLPSRNKITLVLNFEDVDGVEESASIMVEPFKGAGTYPLGGSSEAYYFGYREGRQVLNIHACEAGDGSLEITRWDTEARRCEGRLRVVLGCGNSGPAKERIVLEGDFSVPIETWTRDDVTIHTIPINQMNGIRLNAAPGAVPDSPKKQGDARRIVQ
jgi:hypothetical protein